MPKYNVNLMCELLGDLWTNFVLRSSAGGSDGSSQNELEPNFCVKFLVREFSAREIVIFQLVIFRY